MGFLTSIQPTVKRDRASRSSNAIAIKNESTGRSLRLMLWVDSTIALACITSQANLSRIAVAGRHFQLLTGHYLDHQAPMDGVHTSLDGGGDVESRC